MIIFALIDLFWFYNDETITEVKVDGSVREASSTDPDTLEYTIAGQLMHHKS
jgi:hypothetical protein